MERKFVKLPARLYDEWEDALRKELKWLYPLDDRQLILANKDVFDSGSENFVYQGVVFIRMERGNHG